nr:SPX-EXS1 [Phoebe bournei]
MERSLCELLAAEEDHQEHQDLSIDESRIKRQSTFGFSVLDPLRFVKKKIIANFTTATEEKQEVKGQGGGDEEDPNGSDLVQFFSEADEIKDFFDILDGEFNKVNQFYITKETEFLERGEALKKQLQILVDMKQFPDESRRKCLPAKSNSSIRSSEFSGSAEANELTTQDSSPAEELITALERNGLNFIGSARSKTKKWKPKMWPRMENIPVSTPATMWEDLINNPKKENPGDFITRKQIQCAEKMIRGAFVELYRGLRLLKTYSSLNMVAFRKILKKFDKVSKQQASETYLPAVKRSHFAASYKVVRLTDEVESIFTKHFADNDRKKAMKFLRPQVRKASHLITFLVGLFTGSFVTLFSAYIILAHFSGMFSSTAEAGYIETVYPVLSMFALLSLHIFMYGCNLFMWRSTRINYNFIFEFCPSTALKYRDAFLVCTTLMTMVVGAMVIHLFLRSNGILPGYIDAIPGLLFLLCTGLLICPFNIFYQSTRYNFLRLIQKIIFSPFYQVLMVDSFMADQLTSQIPLLRHMEFTACYFIAGCFKTHQYQTCSSGKLYKEFAYVISFMPYYWRAMQCARKWFEDGDMNHVANLGKYVSAMLAAGARLMYTKQPTPLRLALLILTSSLALVYQLYWDFVKDWGLFNRRSKNPLLRDELILKHNSIYYASMAFNAILRLSWVETTMHFHVTAADNHLLDFFLASLEVIRRGHWNFYRLENEQMNNSGNFRAVKAVPLPFHETDTED